MSNAGHMSAYAFCFKIGRHKATTMICVAQATSAHPQLDSAEHLLAQIALEFPYPVRAIAGRVIRDLAGGFTRNPDHAGEREDFVSLGIGEIAFVEPEVARGQTGAPQHFVEIPQFVGFYEFHRRPRVWFAQNDMAKPGFAWRDV
jgi:hypothetical protein